MRAYIIVSLFVRITMKQYLDLLQRIVDEGQWVENERTGIRCLTVIGEEFKYDISGDTLPLVTTRKAFYKSAIAELLGYIRGLNNAAKFADLGTPTWFANANENPEWLKNSNRKGKDDMGFVYGAVAKNWPNSDGRTIDLWEKVYSDLKKGKDDRGEIVTFYNPGYFDKGCLRPCMYEHIFSLLNRNLYLTSVQRSVDAPLGLVFNAVQVAVLGRLMAQITGNTPVQATHKMINIHIYENQLPGVYEQLKRKPYKLPKLHINPNIKSLEDLETWVTVDDFELSEYNHHPAIKYPFAV